MYFKNNVYIDREILFKPVREWMASGEAPIFTDGLPEGAGGELCAPFIEYAGRRLPVETLDDLIAARRELQYLVNREFMLRGVDILDPSSAYIHPDASIGEGTVVYPNVVIHGGVSIGKGCRIGPFAYLRPETTLADGCQIGDFVEVKNTRLGKSTKVSHLTYVGDADVGENVNFGCGTVTVNYDGSQKHRTVVQDNAFIGCNTNLIAPVTVGENAYTAAGSTINRDVPPNALGIARPRQENKPEWVTKKRGASNAAATAGASAAKQGNGQTKSR